MPNHNKIKSYSNPSLGGKGTYPWVVVALLWVVALLNYMDRQMLSTMKPTMQIDIHELQSATNFGYLLAVCLCGAALRLPWAMQQPSISCIG